MDTTTFTNGAKSTTRLLGLAVVFVHAAVFVSFVVGPRQVAVAQSAPPTFNRDVAPILYANCVTCHRPGGSGPFSLIEFENAELAAGAIKSAVSSRQMPPWFADPRYGAFKNQRRLTDAQVATIARWADAGAPRGDGSPPKPPGFPDNGGWDARMNRPPDLVLDLPFGEFPLPMAGEVPTFTVWTKLPLRGDRFVQAIQVRPNLSHAVHHSSLALATLPPGTRLGRGAVFDGGPVLDGVPVYEDGRPFRAASGDEFGRPVFFYVPGGGFMQLPDGLGKRFREDDYLAWGLHLIADPHPGERLRAQVGIWYTRRDPHHEVHTWTVNQGLSFNGQAIPMAAAGGRIMPAIPPGARNLPVTGTLRFEEDVTLYALWPHMHYRGRDMTFTLREPGGKETILLSVPQYNPHWQLTYELERPLKIRRGSVLTAAGHYDNSADNPHNPDPTAEVRFGPQGTDEMYIPFIEVSVDRDDLRFERLMLGR